MLCISTLIASCYLQQAFSQKIWEHCEVFVFAVTVCSICARAVSSVSIFRLLILVFLVRGLFLQQHSISSNSLRKLSFNHPYSKGFDTALDIPNMWQTAYVIVIVFSSIKGSALKSATRLNTFNGSQLMTYVTAMAINMAGVFLVVRRLPLSLLWIWTCASTTTNTGSKYWKMRLKPE